MIFGRLKLGPAKRLHDKVLWADAYMNKADWMTGLAAVVGVIGIGFGLWWADPVAAILIAADVLHDGYRHTGAAIRDLIDEVPRTVDDKELDPLPARMEALVDGLTWVRRSKARIRENGRFLTGIIYVEPSVGAIDPTWLAEAHNALRGLHWRVRGVSLVLTPNSLIE